MTLKEVLHLCALVDVYNIYEFFANCDGFLWTQQKQALDDYKSRIGLSTDVEIVLFDKMQQIEFRRLEQVIEATKSVLEFADDKRNDVLDKLNNGILTIISANGKVSPDESAFYNEWKRTFNLV